VNWSQHRHPQGPAAPNSKFLTNQSTPLITGSVIDPAVEDHQVRIDWGDGPTDVLDLGVSAGGAFTASHTFATTAHLRHDTIVVTALDDEGVASAPQAIDVIV
jgi:hypothetical protein